MSNETDVKANWFSTAVMAPVGFIQQTVNFTRLFTLSSRAVEARAKFDTLQKDFATQARQIGEAQQGIVDTNETLANLESEISGLTSEFSSLIDKR